MVAFRRAAGCAALLALYMAKFVATPWGFWFEWKAIPCARR